MYAATKRGEECGRLLAIKVLRKDQLQIKNLKKFAIAEKNIMSNLNHPFIVAGDQQAHLAAAALAVQSQVQPSR